MRILRGPFCGLGLSLKSDVDKVVNLQYEDKFFWCDRQRNDTNNAIRFSVL